MNSILIDLDDSNDDSLLKPIPLSSKNQNLNLNCDEISPVIKKPISNDDSDDDCILIDVNSNNKHCKSISINFDSPTFTKLINNNDNNKETIETNEPNQCKISNDDENDIQIIEDDNINNKNVMPLKANTSPYTHLKEKNVFKDFNEINLIDNPDWIEFNDQNEKLQSSTPMVIRIPKRKNFKTISDKKSLLKSRLKHSVHKIRKVNKNLFTSESETDKNENQCTSNKNINIQQKDALNYIILCINKNLFQLAETELIETFSEKQLNYELIDNDENFCVRWKCRTPMKTLIQEVKRNENNLLFNCINILDNAIFDQLLILIKCNQLHDYLDVFLDQFENKIKIDQCTNELFDLIKANCHKYGINNVTLIVYKMEQYLKSQRKLNDDSFRRRIENLMAVEGEQSQPINKTRTKRKNLNKHRHEMTADNIDLFLIDCKNKFLHEFHQPTQSNNSTGKITVLNIDSEQDLSMTLFRYTRSLVEQIYRIGRHGHLSNMDFFVQSDHKCPAIDPKDEETSRTLWLQQLLQFPSISSDIAEAIVSRYPKPRSLLKALLISNNPVEMLANISNNHNDNGSTVGHKRVGNELATKIYLFMTSTNPDQVLKTGITTLNR